MLAQAAGLDQGDRPRQAHLPGLQGGAGGLPAIGFRGDVQAQRLAVARHRLDVLDDVALAIVRSQLLDAELRLAVGPRLAQEPGLVGGRHPAYEAEAAGAGKLAVDVAGQAVAAEQFAVDVRLARRQQGTAHPTQAILVEFHAAGHRLGQQFRLAFQRHPRLLLVDQRQPQAPSPDSSSPSASVAPAQRLSLNLLCCTFTRYSVPAPARRGAIPHSCAFSSQKTRSSGRIPPPNHPTPGMTAHNDVLFSASA